MAHDDELHELRAMLAEVFAQARRIDQRLCRLEQDAAAKPEPAQTPFAFDAYVPPAPAPPPLPPMPPRTPIAARKAPAGPGAFEQAAGRLRHWAGLDSGLSWEILVGTVWLPRIGMLLLLAALAFFFTFAVQHWGGFFYAAAARGIGLRPVRGIAGAGPLAGKALPGVCARTV